MRFASVLLTMAFVAGVDAFVAPRAGNRVASNLNTKLGATVQGTNGAAAAPLTETTVAAVPKVAQRWRKSTKQG